MIPGRLPINASTRAEASTTTVSGTEVVPRGIERGHHVLVRDFVSGQSLETVQPCVCVETGEDAANPPKFYGVPASAVSDDSPSRRRTALESART